MNLADRPLSGPNSIPLAPSYLRRHGRAATEECIRLMVRSVKFELLEADNAFRLLGPEMSYHGVDPYLAAALRQFGANMTVSDIASFKSRRELFDLTFEDSWTGWFIAEQFAGLHTDDAIILIHLDDHTDMMPTLLECSQGMLWDSGTGRRFDPAVGGDWTSAINSGGINIGNYITPFYYSRRQVHVRHLNNSNDRLHELHSVIRKLRSYEIVPDKQFADIQMVPPGRPDSAGTCVGGPDVDELFKSLPAGRIIVHIDLDYFINDFNGASRGDSYIPDPQLRVAALRKLDRFFASLRRTARGIDRWIVGTSPGFCSAYHWQWLLTQIEERIGASDVR